MCMGFLPSLEGHALGGGSASARNVRGGGLPPGHEARGGLGVGMPSPRPTAAMKDSSLRPTQDQALSGSILGGLFAKGLLKERPAEQDQREREPSPGRRSIRGYSKVAHGGPAGAMSLKGVAAIKLAHGDRGLKLQTTGFASPAATSLVGGFSQQTVMLEVQPIRLIGARDSRRGVAFSHNSTYKLDEKVYDTEDSTEQRATAGAGETRAVGMHQPHLAGPGAGQRNRNQPSQAQLFNEEFLKSLIGECEPDMLKKLHHVSRMLRGLFDEADYEKQKHLALSELKSVYMRLGTAFADEVDHAVPEEHREKDVDFGKFVEVAVHVASKCSSDSLLMARLQASQIQPSIPPGPRRKDHSEEDGEHRLTGRPSLPTKSESAVPEWFGKRTNQRRTKHKFQTTSSGAGSDKGYTEFQQGISLSSTQAMAAPQGESSQLMPRFPSRRLNDEGHDGHHAIQDGGQNRTSNGSGHGVAVGFGAGGNRRAFERRNPTTGGRSSSPAVAGYPGFPGYPPRAAADRDSAEALMTQLTSSAPGSNAKPRPPPLVHPSSLPAAPGSPSSPSPPASPLGPRGAKVKKAPVVAAAAREHHAAATSTIFPLDGSSFGDPSGGRSSSPSPRQSPSSSGTARVRGGGFGRSHHPLVPHQASPSLVGP